MKNTSSNKIEELDNMDNNDDTSEDLSKLLELEKQKTLQFEEKLKHVLADFQNLSKKNEYSNKKNPLFKTQRFVKLWREPLIFNPFYY